tara:strand:- start:63 stop:251 length:189 start_codon:yes stop_codon:yes gene_type:complete
MIHLKDLKKIKQQRDIKKMIVFGKPLNNKEIKRRFNNFFNDTKIFLYGVAILLIVYLFFNII